jgi:hypothetical protein
MMVVIVNIIFSQACLSLSYLNLTNGVKFSINQNNAIPPARIKPLCQDGIDSK